MIPVPVSPQNTPRGAWMEYVDEGRSIGFMNNTSLVSLILGYGPTTGMMSVHEDKEL
jgi:hypothetical protein